MMAPSTSTAPVDQDQRVFVVGPERQRGGAGAEVEIDADVVGVAARRRRGALEVADEDGGDRAVELGAWQLVVVLERGRAVAGGRGLGDPELDPLESSPVATGALLGVRDASAGGHQVELSCGDDLLGAERVAVERLAFEQPGDGLQADVGVRCDVQTVPLVDGGGPHVVEEAPGSDGSATSARKRPPYAEGADPALAALGDLDTCGDRMVGGVGDGGSVGGGDRSAHDALGSSRHTAARYPPRTAWMSRTAGVAAGGKDRVGGVGRVATRPLRVRRPGEHLVVDVLGEVQLAGERTVADLHDQVDVHGSPGIPARIDGAELDHAGRVGWLAAAKEGVVRQVLRRWAQSRR